MDLKKKPHCIVLVSLIILLLWILPGYSWSAGRGVVTAVLDGDTIELADGQRVRYLGIDCPEMGGGGRPAEFLAEEAYLYNRSLVLKREVGLEDGLESRDRYGRLLAYVFRSDGLFVNKELVKKGLAQVLYFGPWMKRFDELLKGQREAMQERRGIWARILEETSSHYRGQSGSRRFHRPDCAFGQKIAPKNLIAFSSKKEAYWQGFSPCRNCKP